MKKKSFPFIEDKVSSKQPKSNSLNINFSENQAIYESPKMSKLEGRQKSTVNWNINAQPIGNFDSRVEF